MPKDNVLRLRKAENVLSKLNNVSYEIENDINIVFYINDWKMEINFSQDTLFRMTGSRTAKNTSIDGDQTKPFDFYLIKDNEERYYKLRFLNFYNSAGEKGAPQFEFQEL